MMSSLTLCVLLFVCCSKKLLVLFWSTLSLFLFAKRCVFVIFMLVCLCAIWRYSFNKICLSTNHYLLFSCLFILYLFYFSRINKTKMVPFSLSVSTFRYVLFLFLVFILNILFLFEQKKKIIQNIEQKKNIYMKTKKNTSTQLIKYLNKIKETRNIHWLIHSCIIEFDAFIFVCGNITRYLFSFLFLIWLTRKHPTNKLIKKTQKLNTSSSSSFLVIE